ncbi:MAG: DUF4115 domain-containing protein [Alphaproteobacteria bacterium]|nr:DUF4115 domain-containing protein [Alphaproteobacteria bacterium]
MTSPRRQTNLQSTRYPREPESASIVNMPLPSASEREPKLQLERVGDILRRTREKLGEDLQGVAEYLCIRRGYLEALEDSRYDEFPADAYVIGFLRSYAEYLGLDSKDAIERYRNEMSGRRKKPSLTLPTPIVEGRAPSVFIIVGALVAVILVYALWYALSTSDRASVSEPAALPSTPSAEAPANVPTPVPTAITDPAAATATPLASTAPSPSTPAPQETTPAPALAAQPAAAPAVTAPIAEKPATPPGPPPRLVIRATQSSWIMLADTKGQTLFDRVLKPGETYKVPDMPDLTLTTGNGGGIVLVLDGADLPKLSASSSGVIRNIPLDTASLKALPSRD